MSKESNNDDHKGDNNNKNEEEALPRIVVAPSISILNDADWETDSIGSSEDLAALDV